MHLDWINYRCPKIIKILQSSDSDIICLQEVQMDQINELFYNADYNLNFSSNYTIIVQNVSRDHQVGCAVLVKKEKFTVYAVESRSRALIVVLEPKQQCVDRNNDHDDSDSNNNTPLFLINCHLEAGVNMEEKRYYQIRSMLQRLQKHVNGYNKRPNNKASRSNNIDPYILIAGDMNSYINSNKICSIYNLFSTGKISRQLEQRLSKHGRDTTKSSSQYKNASLPFLPLHDVYKHKYSFLSSIAKPREYKYGSRMNAIITMSLVGSAPQQQLQLKREQRVKNYNTIRNMFFANNKRNDGSVPSAESIFINDDNLKEDLLEMTFTGGSVLDYIWASDKFFVPRDNNDKQTDNEVSIQSTENNFQTQSATSWPIHPWMLDETMIGCIRSTSPTSNRRKSRLWPSHVIPSDHIPIGIKFSLP